MKINYKVSEVNMKLIEADTPNKAMWDELTKDPKTHRVCELTLSFFSVLFSWLSLLCEITYRHHLAVVSVRRKRYKAIIRIRPLNSLILLKNLGGHHLLLIISFQSKNTFLFQQEFLQSIEDRFLCICCQEAVSQPITVECGHSTCKVCQIILSIKHLVFVESIFFMTPLKFLEIFRNFLLS